MRRSIFFLLVACAATVYQPYTALAAYTKSVTFKFDENAISYNGVIKTAYLLIDKAGGMNPQCKAKPMTKSGSVWSVGAQLAEGDYIYVFVANAEQYVNLADCDLNPDDVPDANFFNDPNPEFSGFGGQFGKDNVYAVRDPLRPQFVTSSTSPKPGTLFVQAPVVVSLQAKPGSDGTPIDPVKVTARLHQGDPAAVFIPSGATPQAPAIAEVDKVSVVSAGEGLVTITATLDNPPEGFLQLDFSLADQQGRAGDDASTLLIVNRVNEPPVANAGPTRFGELGSETQLDGGQSMDPDRVGIKAFAWRQISGPGTLSFQGYDQERGQRDGFVVLLFDDAGNGKHDPLANPGAGPRVTATAPGVYTVGLKVQDHEGAWSAESETELHIVGSFDATIRPHVDVVMRGAQILLDGRLTIGGLAAETFKWVPDARNPHPVALSTSDQGRVASFAPPPAGSYFFHLQIGSSFARTVVVRVDSAGEVTGQELDDQDRFWKEEAVIYTIFIRRYADSDGDGHGDIQGLIGKLPYLKDLGVNVLWILPITPGPTSHGYAATALFDIHPDYGTLADWDQLTAEAKKLGIRIMLDMVANHTSDQHLLFRAAMANETSVLRDWYVFNPGNTDRPFEFAFDFSTLPSLNYNNPHVRKLFLDFVRFWMDHGVDAFRCDIAAFVPPSFWREVRREMLGRQPGGAMLAEILPPSPGFFDEQFDLAYDTHLYWTFKDIFAKTGGLDAFNQSLVGAEHFVQQAYIARVRERVEPSRVLRMRYLNTQDEDRFLLQAGRKRDVLQAASGALLSLPGTPMVYYGDEQAIEQMRGWMKFGNAGDAELHEHYRRLLRVRNSNPGLQGQDFGTLDETGDSYTRINNDGDPGGLEVFSFARYGSGQHFIVLVNRYAAGGLGTPVTFWPPKQHLQQFGDETLWLVNHLDPNDQVETSRVALENGMTASVGSHETKVYQITEAQQPDADNDGVLDAHDTCRGTANSDQADADGDGVGDVCDTCEGTERSAVVGIDGCAATAGTPRQHYRLDGQVDDEKYLVAEHGDIKLYASFNGRSLYVAATAAKPGSDMFILVSPSKDSESPAPYGKAGTVALAGGRFFLADEGESNHHRWHNVVGAARSHSPPMALAEGGSGVLEGTLNMVETFGEKMPKEIYIAAVRYGTSDGDGLLAQTPAGNDDGDVSDDELLAFELKDPTPTPPPPPTDSDGDGLNDDEDNCPAVKNAEQRDFDKDGIGDLCDLCPSTKPGAAVDGWGCENDPGKAHPDDPTDGDGQSEGCACDTAAISADGALWPALLLLGLLRRRILILLATAALLFSTGCLGTDADSGVAPACASHAGSTYKPCRVFRGRLRIPDAAKLPPAVRALQLVAVTFEPQKPDAKDKADDDAAAADAAPAEPVLAKSELLFGPALAQEAGSGHRSSVPFSIVVPCEVAISLLVQIPGTSAGNAPGQMVAAMSFARSETTMSTLIPQQTDELCGGTAASIDLGLVDLELGPTPTLEGSSITLGDGQSSNPLDLLDTDGDGSVDSADDDDDDDGLFDQTDPDANGDGVEDAKQGLAALPDADEDGTPDLFQ